MEEIKRTKKMDSKTGMYYLNYNIEKVQDILLEPDTIRKIAKMRVDTGDAFTIIINIRIWADYSIEITPIQPGGYDNYKDTDRLNLSFEKYNIWDSLDGIKDNDDGTYWDEHNKETFTINELADLVVENELYRLTESEIKEFISDLKEQAEKCPHCGSTNIRKHGLETHSDGDHQRFQCKECYHYFTSEWIL